MQLFVHHAGQQQGPLDLDAVRAQLAAGSLLGSDLGWHEGMAEWAPLSTIPALGGSPAVAAPFPPPVPGAPGGYPGGQGPGYAMGQPETSGLAIASLVLGLCVFILGFLTGLPAVICGHLSLSRIKQSGGIIRGRGMAITGLIFGYLSLLIIPIAILAGLALPVFAAVQSKGQQVKTLAEAKQVALACKLYAGDHDGNFPAQLTDLIPTYMADDHLLAGQLTANGPKEGYDYFGGKETDPATQVLLSSHGTTRDHKKIVVHVDATGGLERQ